MSRKLLAFLLHELDIVRVKCGHCKNVTEVPASQVGNQFGTGQCPLCRKMIAPNMPGVGNPFMNLAAALDTFKQLKSTVEIEFVLPDPS